MRSSGSRRAPRGRGVVFGQVGDDEARVGAFEEVFGFGDDATRATPGFLGAVVELSEHAHGVAGHDVAELGVLHFLENHFEQAFVLGEAQ